MKTAVRIQEFQEDGYGFLTIQILNKKYKDSDTMESPGYISFQRTLGEEGDKRFYGMRFKIDTTEVGHIKQMAKIADYIKKNSTWDSQPDEILNVIGAVEYVVYNHDFIPKSKEGENLYYVMKGEDLWTKIIAPNDIVAQKQLDKKGINGAVLEFKEKIVL